MGGRTVRLWFLVLVVGVLTLALPAAALAQDGGGSTDGGANLAIPGIFSLLLGSGGTAEGGALVLGPMQFDLAALNSTAKVEGLQFGNGQFDWDAVQISQSQPSGSPAFQVSEAQATVRGPSTGYTSDVTAHVKVQPNEAVQGEATVGIAYDGLARSMGLMIGDANLTANTAPVGVQVTNLNTGAGTLSSDEIRLSVPATGGSVALSGLQTGSTGLTWDSLTMSQPQVQLGENAALSDLTLVVHGPSQGYAAEGGVRVELSAGELGSAEAQIGLMYDPSSGKFYAALVNGTASLTTDNLSVELSGISYMGSTLSIDTVTISSPTLRIDGQISGVTVGGGSGVDFQEAWVRYLPDPAAGGSFNGVMFKVQKSDGSYLVTTQALVTPVAKQ